MTREDEIQARLDAATGLTPEQRDLLAYAPDDLGYLLAEVERLQAAIEAEPTTQLSWRGIVTGCTNRGHLHLADAQANLLRASLCSFEGEA